jgi:hypothetical protein
MPDDNILNGNAMPCYTRLACYDTRRNLNMLGDYVFYFCPLLSVHFLLEWIIPLNLEQSAREKLLEGDGAQTERQGMSRAKKKRLGWSQSQAGRAIFQNTRAWRREGRCGSSRAKRRTIGRGKRR